MPCRRQDGDYTDLFGAQLPVAAVFFLFGQGLLLSALVVAYILARKHKGREHHYLMISIFLVDQLVFKPLMISRALSIWGPYPWSGTQLVYHMYLDIAVAILGVANIYLGFRYRIKKDRRMYMPAKGKIHRYVGVFFIIAWIVTYASGALVMYQAYYP